MSNYVDYGLLDVKISPLARTQELHVELKSMGSEIGLDVRKWNKFENMQEFRATKKGLLMTLAQWKIALPLIAEFVEKNSSATILHEAKASEK